VDRLVFLDDDGRELDELRPLVSGTYDYVPLLWPQQEPTPDVIKDAALFVSDPRQHRDRGLCLFRFTLPDRPTRGGLHGGGTEHAMTPEAIAVAPEEITRLTANSCAGCGHPKTVHWYGGNAIWPCRRCTRCPDFIAA
jgi:hypothetical protein